MSSSPIAGPRPADRLVAALWVGLAVVAAVVASILVGALAATTLPVLVGTTVTRSGMDVAGVACVGLGLVGAILPTYGPPGRAAAPVRARADRLLVGASGVWLVLVVLGVAFRAADGYGRPVTSLGGGDVLAWATQLAAGRGMVLTAVCAGAVFAFAVARLLRPEAVPGRIPLAVSLLGVLTPAVTGHASSETGHELAVTTAGIHVAAAALWVGGLGALLVLVARRRDLLASALPKFSTLAGACIVAVAVSGVLTAQVRLGSWAALFGTGYGALVIAKSLALVPLGGLGWIARRRIAAGHASVLQWAGLEVALMAVVLGLAAALTQTSP